MFLVLSFIPENSSNLLLFFPLSNIVYFFSSSTFRYFLFLMPFWNRRFQTLLHPSALYLTDVMAYVNTLKKHVLSFFLGWHSNLWEVTPAKRPHLVQMALQICWLFLSLLLSNSNLFHLLINISLMTIYWMFWLSKNNQN